ncbi:MAG TPA: hypothetical protein VJA44_06735 [Acidimicrobiia bacterium]|nr:hypothetical protein [Acidimicrobiia bacterium]
MKAFLKNRPYALLVTGLLLMATSVGWEYVRVNPDYRFVITPWSLRGYQFTQGKVIAATAVALLVLAWLLVSGRLKARTVHASGIVAFMVLYAVAAAVVTDAGTIRMAVVGLALIAFMGAALLGVLADRFVPETVPASTRRLIGLGVRFGGFLVLLLAILNPIFGGADRPVWLVFLVGFGVLGGVSVVRPPEALAGWRTMLNAIFAVWLMSITMAASLRVTLLRLQVEANGVSAEMGDVGITSGVLIAWLGGLLAFIGATGLWARRRDEIAARDRAHRQQAAARESEMQLAGSSA